jgi:hypothetical protein
VRETERQITILIKLNILKQLNVFWSFYRAIFNQVKYVQQMLKGVVSCGHTEGTIARTYPKCKQNWSSL